MNVDLKDFSFWWQIAQAVALVALWLRKPGQDAAEQLVHFKATVAEADGVLKGRLDVLEERVKHMPTGDEMQDVQVKLGALSAKVGSIEDTVLSMRAGINRIEDFLRNTTARSPR